MIRRSLLVLAVAAVAAGSAAASLSPQDYRKRANALCARAGRSLDALPSPGTRAKIPGYLRRGLALQRPFVRAFAALAPPAALRSLHETAVSLGGQELAGVEAVLAKIDGGEDPQIAFAEIALTLGPISTAEVATYRKLGLAACVKLAAS